MFRIILLASFIALAPISAVAQPPSDVAQRPTSTQAAGGYRAALSAEEIVVAARESFERLVTRRTGRITLGGGLITLNVPAGYYYLNPNDSQRTLVEAWHNPPGAPPLGILMQDEISAVDEGSWGVILTLESIGHVLDSDATKIDYAAVLHGMQGAQAKDNVQREERGAPPVEIVGWARAPHYDPASRNLVWATELKVGESDVHVLDYNARVLGRETVLSLQFFAAMKDIVRVEQALPAVLAIPKFNDGYRYDDFDPKTDNKPTFGIAGLIESTWPPAVRAGDNEASDPS
jgi:uncharacterized membrane-anchored protein